MERGVGVLSLKTFFDGIKVTKFHKSHPKKWMNRAIYALSSLCQILSILVICDMEAKAVRTECENDKNSIFAIFLARKLPIRSARWAGFDEVRKRRTIENSKISISRTILQRQTR
jgi:hypothetical protein